MSGWALERRERRDFLHGPRRFQATVQVWRKGLLKEIEGKGGPLHGLFPKRGEDPRGLLDVSLGHLIEVSRILDALHGAPDLGNHADPVDELVYIILSRKTHESAYQGVFGALRTRFETWDDLLAAPATTTSRLIRSSGLSSKKTLSIRGALQALVDRFGTCTLDPARGWSDAELESFLCSLPEISRKSAYCIMMYSFGRKVFPVDTHVGRVLSRIGPYRELGLDLSGLDHKKLQAVLADLIPPPLRLPLHVNLVAHGRATCTALRPRCEACAIRKLCNHYRTRRAAEAAASSNPTTVDLFCGAGGLSLGFEQAGFRSVLALDSNEPAIRTYRLNHPGVPDSSVLCQPIESLGKGELLASLRRKRPDVLLAAPPCQGFSSAGFRSKATRQKYFSSADPRNDLFAFVIMAAVELRPRLVLLENVPGMHSARKGMLTYMEEAARYLEEVGGYTTDLWKLNAVEFGVPQDRNRMFLVASRLAVMPARPPAEYQNPGSRESDLDALPPVTLEEATFDLPPLRSGEGQSVSRARDGGVAGDPRARRYLLKFNLVNDSGIHFNHACRDHNVRDIELYRTLRPGENSVHAVARHGREDLMRYRKDVFDDKYMKLRPDAPCKTIVSHLAKDGNGYVHPAQARALTLREAARVQSFPDDHPFCGSVSDQWIQLGNAVPPIMARAIGRSFLRALQAGAGR